MNWNMLGAIAEVFSALAVAISLLYVATQVRLANRLAKAEAFRAAATQSANLTAMQSTDPIFRSAFHKVYVQQLNRDALSQDEATAFALWFSSQLELMAQVHREVSLGILTSDAYRAWGEQIAQLPYVRTLWPHLKRNYTPEFVALIETWVQPAAVSALPDRPSS